MLFYHLHVPLQGNFYLLNAAEGSARRKKDGPRPLREHMSGTSVAGPRLNAYPSRNSRPAPKEYIREPLCIYPQIASGFPFFQLKPIRSKVGETDAVVVKKGRSQVQSVGPTGYLRLFKSDAVVLDTVF